MRYLVLLLALAASFVARAQYPTVYRLVATDELRPDFTGLMMDDGTRVELDVHAPFGGARSVPDLDLVWRADIYPESHTVRFTYELGSGYDLYFSKKNMDYPLNPIVVVNSMTQFGLSGTGTQSQTMYDLTFGSGWDMWIDVVDDDGDILETLHLQSISPLPEAYIWVSDAPYMLGPAMHFPGQVSEYGEGYPNRVAIYWFYLTDLATGYTYVRSDTLAGVGTLTNEDFGIVIDQNHDHEYCAELSYQDGGLAPIFGPCFIIGTCDTPIFMPGLSTSIPDVEVIATNLVVSPNPVEDHMSIAGYEPHETIDIIDAAGRTVRRLTMTGSLHQVSDLRPGFYILRSEDGSRTGKFIKH